MNFIITNPNHYTEIQPIYEKMICISKNLNKLDEVREELYPEDTGIKPYTIHSITVDLDYALDEFGIISDENDMTIIEVVEEQVAIDNELELLTLEGYSQDDIDSYICGETLSAYRYLGDIKDKSYYFKFM